MRGFADMSAEVFAEADDMPTYLGMRLIAIDGTDVALENSLYSMNNDVLFTNINLPAENIA